jgi:hypothetical protein
MTPGRYPLGIAEKIVKKSRCLVFFRNGPSLFTFGRGQIQLDKHGRQILSIRHIEGVLGGHINYTTMLLVVY